MTTKQHIAEIARLIDEGNPADAWAKIRALVRDGHDVTDLDADLEAALSDAQKEALIAHERRIRQFQTG